MKQEPSEGILGKVQKLMDKAWSTTFPAERESLLAKAEELMLRFSIEQFMLEDPTRQNMASVKSMKPELREFWYMGENTYGNSDGETMTAIQQMFYSLTTHVGGRVGHFGYYSAKVVGFPADLDFLELMFLGLKMHLISNVEPTVVPDSPWEQNLVAFKQAGMKWEDIHKNLLGHPDYRYANQPWERNIGVAFTAVYSKWRKANPDEPANTGSPKLWRKSFIQGYTEMIRQRLSEMRANVIKNDSNLPALLADKKSVVEEAFLEMFPPPPAVKITASYGKGRMVRYKAPTLNRVAMSAGRNVAATADLSGREGRVGTTKKGIGS